jgi:hypothetical protein
MRRRDFIAFIGGAVVWPRRSTAQQVIMPAVGFLGSTTPQIYKQNFVDVIQAGMADRGYVEGRNVAFEYRWENNQPEQLPQLAPDLVRRRPR